MQLESLPVTAPGAAAPQRPLLVLGLALAVGSAVGLAPGIHSQVSEALWASAALLLVHALLSRWVDSRCLPHWAAWVAALALLRASLVPLPEAGSAAGAAPELQGRVQEQSWSQGSWWIAPEQHSDQGQELLGCASHDGWGARARLVHDQERVVVLGGEWTPWPRGLAPARAGKALEFNGRRELLPDEVLRLEAAPQSRLHALLAPLEAPYRAALDTLRQRARQLEADLPRGWAAATLFGEQGELDPGLADLFTRTGTRHILAVSGMHLVLLAALLLAPLASLLTQLTTRTPRTRERVGRVLRVARALLLLCYVPLAGAVPPVTRSAIALALGMCAPLWPAPNGDPWRVGRSADALSLWGLGLSLECSIDPTAPLSVSVQLSYLAALGLILGAAPLARALERACALLGLAPGLLLGAGVWRQSLHMVHGKLLRWSCMALAASLSAVLATLPIAWSRFGEWSPVGILATPLAVPLFGWLLSALWLAMLAPSLVPAWALEAPTKALLALLELCDRLPASPCVLPPRPALLVVACVLACYGALCWRASRQRRALRLAAFGSVALLLPWSAAPPSFELQLLDVGHGTAAVLRAPGEAVWVFDAGSRERPQVGPLAVGPLLAQWEAVNPVLVLSHLDQDHASAMPWLVERFAPRAWHGAALPGVAQRLPRDCLQLAPARGALALPVSGTSGLCLSLLRGGEHAGNEGSYSLLIDWRGRRAVLSGDAEQEGLAEILELLPQGSPLDLLLAPHHGSDTPLWGALLARTRPRELWVSAGAEPELGREYRRLGLPWRSTADEGPLQLRWGLSGGGEGDP